MQNRVVDRLRVLLAELQREYGGQYGWKRRVSERLGLDPSLVTRLYQDPRNIRSDTLSKILNTMEMSSAYFWDEWPEGERSYKAYQKPGEQPLHEIPYFQGSTEPADDEFAKRTRASMQQEILTLRAKIEATDAEMHDERLRWTDLYLRGRGIEPDTSTWARCRESIEQAALKANRKSAITPEMVEVVVTLWENYVAEQQRKAPKKR